MQIGIFGFQKTGKTTLFNTLTGLDIPRETYSQGAMQAHIGMATVPDDRLDKLSTMFHPQKTVFAKVQYVDVIGIQASHGLTNDTFVSELKNADALLHVVRSFEDASLVHSQGNIDPKKDIETMELELILMDLSLASKRIEKLQVNIKKAANPGDKKQLEILQKCVEALEKETPLREVSFTQEELQPLRGYTFLSAKPLMVALNLSENKIKNIQTTLSDYQLENFSKKPWVSVIPVSAKIEMEIAKLSAQDRMTFMQEIGLEKPCLNRLIQNSYSLLGLISFFTVGEDECRAWTIHQNTIAHKAAGTIHSDIERGFIRAEIISYQDLIQAGSWQLAKAQGKMRLEGKEYIIQDGDIAHFRFNV